MKTRHTLGLLALTATLAAATPAAAEEDVAVELDPDAIDKLRACATEYTKEKYAEALVLCKESLGIQRNAATLLTIGKTYEKLGRCDLARDFAEQSLAQETLGLDPPNQKKANDFIGGLPGSEYCQEPEAPEPTTETRRFGALSYVGAGALALGLGGAGAGMYFGDQAQQQLDALPDAGSQADYDTARASIEADQSLGQALLLSGAGLAVVGVALVVVDAVTVEEVEVAPVVLAPALGPDRVGASLFMRF
jgi:tetratricopeptide (TPR) repeat protein